MDSLDLLQYSQAHHAEMMDVIRLLVTHETPSCDKPRLDTFAALLAERLAAAGAISEIIPNPTHGDHVRAEFAPEIAAPPALVLCHYDTVWPVGSLETHPFRVEEGRAYGPGIFDMQTSLALVEFGLRAVRDLDLKLPRPVVVLITSDEEIGSGTSRELIEAEARRAAHVLVLESPLPGGVL
jgi:glutamate carboxypeptidase